MANSDGSRPWRRKVALVAFLCLVASAGCRTTPPAPELLRGPLIRGEVSHFPGSVLSGAVEQPVVPSDVETAWGVTIVVFALETLPETELAPLAGEIQLITVERGGEPIASHARLGVRGRIGVYDEPDAFIQALRQDEYGRSAPVGRLVGALAQGATTAFRFTEQGGKVGELRVSRTTADGGETQAVRIALVLEGLVTPDAENEPVDPGGPGEERSIPEPIFQRELILLRPRSLAAGGVACFLPSPFKSSPAAALAIGLEIRPPTQWTEEDRPEYEAARAQCAADLVVALDLARQRRTRASRAESLWHGLAVALEELSNPARRRASLVFLSHAVGARVAEDLVLSASDNRVAQLADSVRSAASEEAPADERAVKWLLTRSSYRLLAEALAAGEATPDLEGLLALHAGEVGRRGAILLDLLAGSRSLEDFDARLVSENFTYLEDISPASRFRAFRWLGSRDLAPEAYDPLGDVASRRAALAAAAVVVSEASSDEEI